MRKHFPGEEYVQKEWAIRWTAPKDIADSITLFDSEERAHRLLGLCFGQSGEVMYRTVTYSPWKSERE